MCRKSASPRFRYHTTPTHIYSHTKNTEKTPFTKVFFPCANMIMRQLFKCSVVCCYFTTLKPKCKVNDEDIKFFTKIKPPLRRVPFG